MSKAISTPCRSAVSISQRKSASVPRSGWIALCPPSSAPIAHGLPGSVGVAVAALFRPLRESGRSDGPAADRVRRNPCVQSVRIQGSQSRSLPGRQGSGLQERGNNHTTPKSGPLTFHPNLQDLSILSAEPAIGMPRHQLGHPLAQR